MNTNYTETKALNPGVDELYTELKAIKTIRRESWVEFSIPGTEVNNRLAFPTKGKAKRFIRMLQKEHKGCVEIRRSWQEV